MAKKASASVSGGAHTSHVSPQLREAERQRIIYQLERERHDTWVRILDACRVEGKRQVLATLTINDGVCTYQDLFQTVPRAERTVKKHVGHLHESNIINRDGNPAVISFVDTDVALLVSDALNNTDKL